MVSVLVFFFWFDTFGVDLGNCFVSLQIWFCFDGNESNKTMALDAKCCPKVAYVDRIVCVCVCKNDMNANKDNIDNL